MTHLLRNRGESPEVTFTREATGISDGMLTGVHDIGLIDINGDGWTDMVIGRCETTEVWMNQPPTGIVFAWEGGIPSYVSPGESREVQFQLQPVGSVDVEPGSGKLYARTEDNAWVELAVEDLGANEYRGNLPVIECAESIEFYASGQTVGGTEFTDPSAGPASGYAAIGADGTETIIRLDFEEPATGLDSAE